MKKMVLLVLFIVCQLQADSKTYTSTTIKDEVSHGQNKYGSFIYNRDVIIQTDNFKVNNFWSKFSKGNGNGQSQYPQISKSGTVEVSVEAASICSLYPDLDIAGCSGQKPFLVNTKAVQNLNVGDTTTLLFQKNYDGSKITYNENNSSVFYPLDVLRDQKYYKTDGAKTFKSFFQSMFDAFFGMSFFSSFFTHEVVDKNNNSVDDNRQRYIANIVSGIDQNHLIKKTDNVATDILNTPLSLIDYSENQSSSGSCSLFFFKFSESNVFCQMMSSMPFINWFVSSTPATSYIVDTIQSDTQNALTTLAGSNANLTLNNYQAGTVYTAQSHSTGIISSMIEMMKCFLFGCAKTNEVKEPTDSYYSFTDDNALDLTFAVTNDGSKVDDFKTFKLMGIHSLIGNDHMCQVQKSGFGGWTQTFNGGDSDTKQVCSSWNLFHTQCLAYSTVANTTDGLTPSEWLTKCDKAMETYVPSDSKCTKFFFLTSCPGTQPTFTIGSTTYTVKSYTSASKTALLLDLKLIDLKTSDKSVNLRYKLLGTQN